MSRRFFSKQARYSPPHITLHMPFEWREDKEEELKSVFKRALQKTSPFQIPLSGFGSFPPRVIFVKPENNEALNLLHQVVGEAARLKLNLLSQDAYSRPFHPHITIAFRDLKREYFNLAWSEFKSKTYTKSFTCSGINILKKQGQYWIDHIQLPIV